MPEGIGDRYHRETKYRRGRMPFRTLDWADAPSNYKEYTDAVLVELPVPEPPAPTDLEDVVRRRRSVREFTGEPVGLRQLSYLLWASTGVQRVEQGFEFRTAPSAGALYPIETYIVAGEVEGLQSGLYHYAIRRHALEQLRTGDLRAEAARAALDQSACLDAAVVFVWTAVFRRSKWKYDERAYRYIYMDAGHICENLYLAATGLGLGACAIGALFDEEVDELLGVDGVEEGTVYMAVVGYPSKAL